MKSFVDSTWSIENAEDDTGVNVAETKFDTDADRRGNRAESYEFTQKHIFDTEYHLTAKIGRDFEFGD